MIRKGRHAAARIAAIAAIAAGAPTIASAPAAASTPAPSFACKSGDAEVTGLYIVNSDSPAGASTWAKMCRDHVTTGWYWTVNVTDTAADNRCAHAEITWVKPTGAVDSDFGMWLCGTWNSKSFWTPVRNWTRYSYVRIGAFVDGDGAVASYAIHQITS